MLRWCPCRDSSPSTLTWGIEGLTGAVPSCMERKFPPVLVSSDGLTHLDAPCVSSDEPAGESPLLRSVSAALCWAVAAAVLPDTSSGASEAGRGSLGLAFASSTRGGTTVSANTTANKRPRIYQQRVSYLHCFLQSECLLSY